MREKSGFSFFFLFLLYLQLFFRLNLPLQLLNGRGRIHLLLKEKIPLIQMKRFERTKRVRVVPQRVQIREEYNKFTSSSPSFPPPPWLPPLQATVTRSSSSGKSLWRNISAKNMSKSLLGEFREMKDDEEGGEGEKAEKAEKTEKVAEEGAGEARRSWFSSFLRQKKKGGEQSHHVPTQFQLTTNHSRLDVCHQFINLLFGMDDVGFEFDSQKWRFVENGG